ncbi:MAG: TetR/AcrR family transcriptional regulator, partial [Solirubrobacteraceae bacterium]
RGAMRALAVGRRAENARRWRAPTVACACNIDVLICNVVISLEDPAVRRRAAEAVERIGWSDLTLDELGRALGVSRVTLYRQGIAKRDVLAALRDYLADSYREALWPALTGSGPAPQRLSTALGGLCDVSERHLGLLRALPDDDLDTVFHDPGTEALTRAEIAAGLTRLLRDGVADGSFAVADSAEETATLLLNFIGWTYRHLRSGHRWSQDHARRAVIEFAVRGVSA